MPKKTWFGKGEVRPRWPYLLGSQLELIASVPFFAALGNDPSWDAQEDLPWERWTLNLDIRTGSTERGQHPVSTSVQLG